MEVKKIYLHWTATPYNWHESGHYHTVVQGNGNIVRLTPYDHFLGAHTWLRNSDAVAIAIACMGGSNYWNEYPPTTEQLEAMCKETANLARSLGWKKEDIVIQKIMTHAEAASCKDGCYPHYNYGPVPWGGDGTRWDLMQLTEDGADDGGEVLRNKIKQYMTFNSPPDALKAISIDCNGTVIEGQLYSNMSTYTRISKLASAYNFNVDWNPEKRRVFIYGENLPNPKYIYDNSELENVEKVDICSTDGKIIMSGFLKDNHAFVRVVEFANEFNISLKVEDKLIKLGSLKNYGG